MLAEKIKIVMLKQKVNVKELAKRLNTSSSNITNKFKRDNFSEKELVEIAAALDCDLKIDFVDKFTKQIL
jgi:DNA-binding Xre family transcriptional regulator